jgi:hypothetical protein
VYDGALDDILDPGILDLIHRSLAQRTALCEVVLAIYRVQLTKSLRPMATDGYAARDVEVVGTLASRIRDAAGAASLDAIQAEARSLAELAVSHGRGDDDASDEALLAAGVRLIDGILAAAKNDDDDRPAALN